MKILFITPYGIRSGSEMALWNIMTSLDRIKYQSFLFCKNNGSLLKTLPSNVKYRISNYQLNSTFSRLKNRISIMTTNKGLMEIQLKKIQKNFNPDFWYLNTSVMPEIADLAIKMNIPYAVHFHELESVYSSQKDYMLEHMVRNARLSIGCSKAVCDNLKVMEARHVEILYEAIDTDKIDNRATESFDIREELGIKKDVFLWGMSGASSYRKGFDLFVKIAKEFIGKAHFIWIGRERDLGFDYYVKQLIKFHRLKNVTIIGELSDNYYNYLSSVDGFLLTSREDPFPLVMIEAGYLGKPVVAFESGGASEFIIEGTGYSTTGINVIEMVQNMNIVMNQIGDYDIDLIRRNAYQYKLTSQLEQWEKIIAKHFDK
jgi:L-malate glycosyltransferase